MSHTRTTEAARTARDARHLTKNFTSQLTGKKRGPDPHVRANSYDVDDPRAKVFVRIGDGSVGYGLAYREALMRTADELRRQLSVEDPLAAEREARAQRAEAAAELASYDAGTPAPAGRPATLRQLVARLDELLERARMRLRRIDVTVLQGLLTKLDFGTGALFPCLETIAADAVCSRSAVIGALRRLKHHGFVSWVRRSVSTGAAGERAPQREQTSNAYHFQLRAKMATRVFQRFTQLLVAKVRRLGAVPKKLAPAAAPPPLVKDPGLRAALAGLGALVPNAST